MPVRECIITLQDVVVLLGLLDNGDPVIGDPPRHNMSWRDIVASVFWHFPPSNRFNEVWLQLSWFLDIIPRKLDDNASK